MIELSGKTALVTGGAKRLGASIVLALARAGVHVGIHYRTAQGEAESLAVQARGLGVRAWVFPEDLSHRQGVESLMDWVVESAGPIDFLINNASIFPEQTLNDLTIEEIHRNVDVNALAPLLLGRRLAAQGREGAIVNLLDARISDYDREHVPYHLSKRMLLTLTRIMAVEFAPKVRVNAVAPGLILPPEGKDAAYLESLKDTNLLHRYGSTEGVSEAVLFLLRSGFITGQVIYVDGGRNLRGNMYD
ncbi:MAG TPA: SDR family oxidoreductase [Candidatus Hydrogenedentes bacterium]|nr:SDR family oxidoreductase [Candidatus Hydrogenedentota bacterium]